MFKKIISSILAVAMLVSMSTSVFAEERDVSIPNNISEIIEYSVEDSIIYNGLSIPLYPVFCDKEAALDSIRKLLAKMLNGISEYYSIEALDETAVYEYNDCILRNVQDKEIAMSDKEFNLWCQFFDIFENYQSNNDIFLLMASLDAKKSEISEEEFKDRLAIMLPYTSDLSIEYTSKLLHARAFSEANATAYAVAYAKDPISTEFQYYYNSGDCANFASQILEAGGVSQVDYSPDANKGWWHKVDGKNWLGQWQHSSSQSWRLADVFARYQGAYATTKSNFTFSTNIAKGDFVALDHTSDGSWDHIGYVTAKDSYTGTYGGKTYYDYKIAQHTSNYNAWASSEDCGWDKKEDSNATYARLRRK